jgi:VanZ family protein
MRLDCGGIAIHDKFPSCSDLYFDLRLSPLQSNSWYDGCQIQRRPYQGFMNPKIQRYIRHATFWALVAYWVVLLVATHWPLPRPIRGGNIGDKVIHFIAYATLAALLAIELWWRGRSSWPAYLAIFLGLALFGGFDELTQPLVNRSADWLDWYADLIGIASGLLLARLVTAALGRWFASRNQDQPS